MKLKNKKTGEIKDVESLGHEKSLRDKYGPQITLSWNTEYENLGECKTYNSLAELNADWEDYEEPKVGYIIDPMEEDYVSVDDSGYEESDVERAKELGIWLETKEEAEKAVEKLKAWKRLKDKGFEFIGKTYETDKRFGSIFYKVDEDTYSEDIIGDLDLLFGGEE